MATFLRAWRSERAGLSRAQLAIALHGSSPKAKGVTPRIIREWEAGQPPATTEELEALLTVMRRHGLAEASVERFRQTVLAACLARRYRGLDRATDAGLPSDSTPEAFPNNLPPQVTSFIGRESEVEEVRGLLGRARLVTLVGTRGAGKSRLALGVGAEVLDEWPDGVWLVELAYLSDPSLVPQVALSVLSLREEPQRAPVDTLIDGLRDKRLLLILDDCEHLTEACASLAEALLASCPNVAVLATSREALRAEGEVRWRVPSLDTPTDEAAKLLPPQKLSQYAAVQLFIERATAANPSFEPAGDSVPAVAQICWRLDGIPLAIELAAARVDTLSPREIEERLDERFRPLTQGRRGPLPRRQTLQQAIEWSYELLSADERSLFDQASVFSGSFSLEAAEAVCAEERIESGQVPDLLAGLTGRALVVGEEQGPGIRYRLLETLRAYAAQHLAASGKAAETAGRHAGHYAAWAEEMRPGLAGPKRAECLARLEHDHDNLRSALGWSLRHDPSQGGRLAEVLGPFWMVRGHWTEGRRWLTEAQGQTEMPLDQRPYLVYMAAEFARLQGDYGQARQLLEEGLALARQGADPGDIARGLNSLGNVAQNQGDHAAARRFLAEALEVFRELGHEMNVAAVLVNLGVLAKEEGDYDRARALYEESLGISRRLGEVRLVSATLGNLCNVVLAQGDYAAARGLLEEALVPERELGDKHSIALRLQALGVVASEQGDYAAAQPLYEESLALYREMGARRGAALTLHCLGNLAFDRGDYASARASYEEALAIQRAIGHRSGVATLLGRLGHVASREGDHQAAGRLCEEGLAFARELGDNRSVAWALESAAPAALARGDLAAARQQFEEGLALSREMGERRAIAQWLEGLAELSGAEGRDTGAARLYGSAEALREAIGAPQPPSDRERHAGVQSRARAALGEKALAAAWDAGRALSVDEAVAYALAPPPSEDDSL